MRFCAVNKNNFAGFRRWHLAVGVFAQDAWRRKGVKCSVCAVRQKQAGILSLSAGKWKVFPHTTALVLLLYRSIRYDFSPRRHIAGKPKVDTRSPFQRLLFLLSLES